MYSKVHDKKLRKFDFNLMKVLVVVVEEESVTQAGRVLGTTPSAISASLKSIRKHFGDPILVKVGRKMYATEYAKTLAKKCERILKLFQELLDGSQSFHVGDLKGSISIAVRDMPAFCILPPIIVKANQLASDLSFQLIGQEADKGMRQLTDGEVDFAMGAEPEGGFPSNVEVLKLIDVNFATLVRQDHSEVTDKISLSQFERLKHVLITHAGTPRSFTDAILQEVKAERHVIMTTPSFLTTPFLMCKSDWLLTVPEQIAKIFVNHLPLKVLPPPIHIPSFPLYLTWLRKDSSRSEVKWFVSIVQEGVSLELKKRQ